MVVSMPKVTNPELVIPLRLYGDGAESYSNLVSRNRLNFRSNPNPTKHLHGLVLQRLFNQSHSDKCVSHGSIPSRPWPEENKSSRFWPWCCLFCAKRTEVLQQWTRAFCAMAHKLAEVGVEIYPQGGKHGMCLYIYVCVYIYVHIRICIYIDIYVKNRYIYTQYIYIYIYM